MRWLLCLLSVMMCTIEGTQQNTVARVLFTLMVNGFTFCRLIHQMILMLEVTRGQVVLEVGILLDLVVRVDPTDWMLGTMFTKFLMLRKRQYQMKLLYIMYFLCLHL